jgi:cation diffusion facilitator CzcD-associated flavoprotein CzcO
MGYHYPVIIIGGGQAGLSVSYCLKERRIDNIIFEKHSDRVKTKYGRPCGLAIGQLASI